MNALSKLQTRELVITDYAAVAVLWEKTDEVEIAEGDSLEEIGSYLARNPALSRVAVEGDQIVGAALCGHDGRRGFIYHLAVASSHRGRGIGKLLVNECLHGLHQAGIARAIVLVGKDNSQGRGFWLSCGWEALSEATPMARDVI